MAYQAYAYAGPPAFHYLSSASNSPAPDPDEIHGYVPGPQYCTPQSKRHSRNASYHHSPRAYTSPAYYPSPAFYASNYDYMSPPRHTDYVSVNRSSTRKSRQSVDEAYASFKASTKTVPKARVYMDMPGYVSEQSEPEVPRVHEIRPARRPSMSNRRPVSSADPYLYQTYDTSVETRVRSKPRRATASNGSTPKKSSTPRPTKQAPAVREATAADAHDYNIPAGYSLKNWDPNEEPILLLGSAFDGNSLGKWIYDWTVYHHTAGAPLCDVAGELWLLLIKFSGKMKRADECLERVRNPDSKDVLIKFLKNGDKIWADLKKLLHLCENHMWKGAKKEGGKVSMGEKSGVEFVKTIFGIDRELESTEKLMNRIRLWNLRFDTNCEDILRRPSAK